MAGSIGRRRFTTPRLALGIVLCAALVCKPGDAARAEPPAQEAIDKAVEKGIAYLKAQLPSQTGGRATLAALSLLKCDVPADAPEIKRALQLIVDKVKGGKYEPSSKQEHGYEAGLDAITLETADSEKYKPQIEAIAKYLISVQNPNGDWFYRDQQNTGGDTSITQYGILGLWAASRAGVRVPGEVWDKAAHWHLVTQQSSGGFVYHPPLGGALGAAPVVNTGGATLGMSAAGTASLHICRMYLFPGAEGRVVKKPDPKFPANFKGKRFGVLERIPPESGKPGGDGGDKSPRATSYNPKVTREKIDEAISKGLDYVTQNFTVAPQTGFKNYYLYTLERLTALADLTTIGDHDWYAEGAEHLLKIQAADGSWQVDAGQVPDTSFAVLFLIRATNKMLDRKTAPRRVGTGLLAGGRGLPENLAALQVKDGKVGSRKAQGTIDELLTELENVKAPVESVQKALVESVQLGDREALLGQLERLKTLATHARPEVRRTALWGLGRSRDLRLAPLLIGALNDTDVDVVVEANNALCFLSRRADGVGVKSNPLDGLDEEATADDKTAALNAWRPEALKRWRAWYLTVRPYDERHDLAEPRAASAKQ